MVLALRSWRISWFERTISIRVNRALAIFRFPLVLRNVGAKRFVAIVESTHAPKILKVRNREDILPSNLYTHSILNLVYQTYQEIEHKYGSILNLTTKEMVAQLIQRGLAPQTARRVSISLTRSSGTRRNCRCGVGWRASVTSTIARVWYRNPCIPRFAPLLGRRPNTSSTPD